MNHSFPRLITLLRKEKQLSQKDAAKALGISQALLSHYENGIRECGLDFLVNAAEFYGVSCDYLLGRTPSRFFDSVPENNASENTAGDCSDLVHILNFIFSSLKKFNCPDLVKSVSSYLKGALYKVFRLLYSANPKNPQTLFGIEKDSYLSKTNAESLILQNKIELLSLGKNVPDMKSVQKGYAPLLSTNTLSKENPDCAKAILSIINDVEQR